jgi:hypothetical protein
MFSRILSLDPVLDQIDKSQNSNFPNHLPRLRSSDYHHMLGNQRRQLSNSKMIYPNQPLQGRQT